MGEPANSGEYLSQFPTMGYYCCMGCGFPLYAYDSKYDANCGWPAYEKCYHSKYWGCHVHFQDDNTFAMHRVEITCKRCMGHLGHIFFNEQGQDTERHCVNSVSLKYIEGSEPRELTSAHLQPIYEASRPVEEK